MDPGSGVTVIDSAGGGLVPGGPPLAGDWDDDGDTDLADFAHWDDCMTGPDNPPLGGGCDVFDFEPDVDVDLADFAAFQEAFMGG